MEFSKHQNKHKLLNLGEKWDLIPFQELFDSYSGGKNKIKKGDYLEIGEYPVIDQGKDFIGGYTNNPDKLIDGLLPKIIFGDHTRRFKHVDFRFGVGADGTKILTPKIECHVKYLYYYFKSINLPDTGYNRHFKYLKRFVVPLPPLQTQRKIAAVLDQAEALRQKRRQSIDKLDELTWSVFLDMFGDPDKNPQGWETGKFSDLAIIERNSVSPDEFAEHNYYLGLQDIEKDTGKILDRTEGAKVDLKSNKYSFNQNHILYGKLRPYLNKVASPDFSGFCSTDILPIRPIENISNKSFLTYLMRHQSFVKYADTKSSGANLPRISPKLVKRYPAILPPLQKQEEFSLKSIRINWLKEKKYFQLEEFHNLFDSLLQQAFKGELFENKESELMI